MYPYNILSFWLLLFPIVAFADYGADSPCLHEPGHDMLRRYHPNCCDDSGDSESTFASGFYIGFQGGTCFTEADRSDVSLRSNLLSPSTLEGDTHSISVIGSAHIGYLRNVDSFIFGIEPFFSYSPVRNNSLSLGFAFKYKVQHMWSLGGRARVGFLVNPHVLLYGIMGGKVTRVEYETLDYLSNNAMTQENKYMPGLEYGIGIEKELECGGHRIRFEVTQTCYIVERFNTIQTTTPSVDHNTHYNVKDLALTVGYSFAF